MVRGMVPAGRLPTSRSIAGGAHEAGLFGQRTSAPIPTNAGVRSSEGGFDDIQPVGQDGDDIETDVPGSPRGPLGQPARRQPTNSGPLGGGDGLGRRTEGEGAAGLDFAEHKGAGLADHQVQLALAAAPVPLDHLVTVVAIPGRGLLLAGVPESTPVSLRGAGRSAGRDLRAPFRGALRR